MARARRHMREAWVGAAVLAFLLAVLPGVSHAQQLSPRDAQATQAALNNLINDCAQARERHQQLPPACLTRSPTSTPVPPKATQPAPPPPTEAPPAQDPPKPTRTPDPCWLTDQQIGDPDNGFIRFDPLWYPDGSPALDDDGNQLYGPTQIPCDSTPTPIPTDTPPEPPTATAVIATAAALAPPARQVAPALAPPPPPQVVTRDRVVVVTATPTSADESAPGSSAPLGAAAYPPSTDSLTNPTLYTPVPTLAPTACPWWICTTPTAEPSAASNPLQTAQQALPATLTAPVQLPGAGLLDGFGDLLGLLCDLLVGLVQIACLATLPLSAGLAVGTPALLGWGILKEMRA